MKRLRASTLMSVGGLGRWACVLGLWAVLALDRVGAAEKPMQLRPGPALPASLAGRPLMVPRRSDVKMEGMRLVWIPPGEFRMGSTNGQADERPVTSVKITRGFWMGRYEVTQADYKDVMGAGDNPSRVKGDFMPVETVSWKDATLFCQRLTAWEKEARRLPEGYEFRLPTEAEWEYACRAGTTGSYGGLGGLDDLGWYRENSGESSHPVGGKRANAWGLFDMHGNVWEWCLDRYGAYRGGVVTDPVGSSEGKLRVTRGGGWWAKADSCRVSFRDGNESGYRGDNLGFRVVCAPSP